MVVLGGGHFLMSEVPLGRTHSHEKQSALCGYLGSKGIRYPQSISAVYSVQGLLANKDTHLLGVLQYGYA